MSTCDCPVSRNRWHHRDHWTDCAITPIYKSMIRDVGLPELPGGGRWMWAIDIFGYWYPGSKELAGLA